MRGVCRGTIGFRTALAIATVAAVVAPPLEAQEPISLSLEEALRMAEGSNPGYRRASNDALLNVSEMRTTWLETLLPSASVQLSTYFRGNRQGTGVDNLGNPITADEFGWNYFSNTTQALSLQWNVQGLSLFQTHRRQRLVNEGRDHGSGGGAERPPGRGAPPVHGCGRAARADGVRGRIARCAPGSTSTWRSVSSRSRCAIGSDVLNAELAVGASRRSPSSSRMARIAPPSSS